MLLWIFGGLSPLPVFPYYRFPPILIFSNFRFLSVSGLSPLPVFPNFQFSPLPVIPHFQFRPQPEVENTVSWKKRKWRKPGSGEKLEMEKTGGGEKLLKWGQIIKTLFYLSALELFCCLPPLFLLFTSLFCCLPHFFCFLPLSQTVRLPIKKLQNATNEI